MWYGLPFVSYGVVLIVTVNSIGAVFQLAYITLFITYADKRKKVTKHCAIFSLVTLFWFFPRRPLMSTFFFLLQLKMGALLIGVLGLFALIVYVSSVFFDHPIRMTLVGYLSVASLISMFASPLLVIVSLYLSLQIS
jgi:solute carrier family 50 (sugar transporter)